MPLHSLPPTPAEEPIKRTIKKQSELSKFLNDTRGGLHDTGWLVHCRRAYRTEMKINEEIKVSFHRFFSHLLIIFSNL